MSIQEQTQGPAQAGPGLEPSATPIRLLDRVVKWLEQRSSSAFLLPAVLVILCLSLFPLVLSLYISLIRL